MKQVKKLLVILPLVALFVLGNLPVLAETLLVGWDDVDPVEITVSVKKTNALATSETFAIPFSQLLTEGEFRNANRPILEASKAEVADVESNLEKAIKSHNSSWSVDSDSLKKAAKLFANGIALEKLTAGSKTDPVGYRITFKQPKKATINVTEAAQEEPKKTDSSETTKPTADSKTEIKSTGRSIDVVYYENMAGVGTGKEFHRIYNLPADFLQNAIGAGETFEFNLQNLDRVGAAIQQFVEDQLQDGYRPIGTTYRDAANTLLTTSDIATVRMGRPVARTYKVIAYDIHHNRFVFDRLFELEMEDGWRSERDVSKSFYDHSDTLSANYLYAGFATREIAPVIVYRATYLETIARANYLRALNRYGAEIVTFVVPRTIDIRTYHVFPENTRADLMEIVPVPYETWASLQFSSQFMNLPEIFKTRIQKVNEMGFSFREIRYYSGINEITGLLSGYDWNGDLLTSDGDDACFAKVFYDKAVAAAKEEKKVDAATAPQAQIQAPAAGQAKAPVTAANTTTTTAPVNTLPVTGASDSIFLFLSSAALMAVGILFFKKH